MITMTNIIEWIEWIMNTIIITIYYGNNMEWNGKIEMGNRLNNNSNNYGNNKNSRMNYKQIIIIIINN